MGQSGVEVFKNHPYSVMTSFTTVRLSFYIAEIQSHIAAAHNKGPLNEIYFSHVCWVFIFWLYGYILFELIGITANIICPTIRNGNCIPTNAHRTAGRGRFFVSIYTFNYYSLRDAKHIVSLMPPPNRQCRTQKKYNV